MRPFVSIDWECEKWLSRCHPPPPSFFLFSVFLSLFSLGWVSRHRWVWGVRPVWARRTVCEHSWELRMLLYGWILAREWPRAFPPDQRCHVMHRWVSAEECKIGKCVPVGGDFLQPSPLSVGLCWGGRWRLLVPLHFYTTYEISK